MKKLILVVTLLISFLCLSAVPLGYEKLERLIQEQKYQEASKELDPLLQKALKDKNEFEYARLLTKDLLLKLGLHGYETAIEELKLRPWPKDPLPHSMVSIAYAKSLMLYLESYSWEIRSREKVTEKKEFDLKKLNTEEIFHEALSSFEKAWNRRKDLERKSKEALGDLVSANNFPTDVRGSLRDTLTHLLVELLNNTTAWTPNQMNEVYLQSVQDLLGRQDVVSLTDMNVHPLRKISYVLSDLSQWHKKRSENKAALDARLELYEILHQHLTAEAPRKLLMASLEKELKDSEKGEWVSMGYALFARFFLESDAPDSQIQAMARASKGAKLHPGSPGARRCRDVLKQIQMPHFTMEGMNIDGQSKRSFAVQYMNLRKLYFRSIPIDFKKYIQTTKDYSLRPGYRELQELLKIPPAATWSQDLQETADYKSHTAYVTPPKLKSGFYLTMASSSQAFDKGIVQGVQTFFGQVAFNVTRGEKPGEFVVEVMDGETGKPVKDAKVSLGEYNNGHSIKSVQKTNASGVARIKTQSASSNIYFLVEKGDDVIGSRNPMYQSHFQEPETKLHQTFIYSDRSIYRPEQTVLWKIVAYEGPRGGKEFKLAAKRELEVQLRDANQEVVQSIKVTTNAYGSASGSFVLPKGRQLGNWSLSSLGTQSSIKVEEYKRPTFLVEITPPAVEHRLNQEVVIKGLGKYYFGLPLTKGVVKWTVHRRAILPWWCFLGGLNWGNFSNDALVATGMTQLKDNGSFEVKFVPKGDEKLSKGEGITYAYSIKADVTDEGGETRGTEYITQIGFSSVRASILTDKNFYLDGEAPQLRIERTDLNNRPLPGKGVWKLMKLKEPLVTPSPGDIPVSEELRQINKNPYKHADDFLARRWRNGYNLSLYLRSWAEDQTIKSGEISQADLRLPKLSNGVYRISYETKDSSGSLFKEQKEFLVSDQKSHFKIPGALLLERNSVEVGERARVLIMSGYPDQRMIFEVTREGKVIQRNEFIAGKTSPVFEVPVKEVDRGGLGFVLRLVRDYQELQFSQILTVHWSSKEVELSFSVLRDKIKPGSTETLGISLKGKQGRKIDPKTFEVLAYMYDKSLDAFTPHHTPSPQSVYPILRDIPIPVTELGEGTLTYTNLNTYFTADEFTEYQKDHLNFYPSYGIGGPGARGGGMVFKTHDSLAEVSQVSLSSAPTSAPLGKAKGEVLNKSESTTQPKPVEVRTQFSENGFWKPHLIPDDKGNIKLEFVVPDSVTTWNIWAHAVSKDLQSGKANKEVRSLKDLMVRPYLPRFFREGDEAVIRVAVNNASENDIKGTLTFEILDEETKASLAKEFSLESSKSSFFVRAHDSTTVAFKIKAPVGARGVVVKAIAEAGNMSDGELRPLPVLPGRVHLSESKFVTLKDQDQKLLSFKGLLEAKDPSLVSDAFVVTLDAQLFYSVLSSLPYLYNYPYETTEQLMNSFVASGILSAVFKDFPEVAKMAKEFSRRKTRLESWEKKDPNRKMELEETPWPSLSKGSEDSMAEDLVSVLDPDIARNARNKFLKELLSSQTANGGFPWFQGGPPSPFVTLSILYGFSKALEFKVEVPKETTAKAWKYLYDHYITVVVKDIMKHDIGWEFVTFLNYVLAHYPDSSWSGNVFTKADQEKMLDFSMKHWKEHSPYLKSYLARTLKHFQRPGDAKLVWDSVMDSAITNDEEGTHWAREDRSWLWYNDTIESHALALRTGQELQTKTEVLEGIVQWLFMNKKLNHWKSTRRTAEVIYALTHYLKQTKQLMQEERIDVNMGGKDYAFQFTPKKYTGKSNQIIVEQGKISRALLPVSIKKRTRGLAFASATWHYSTESLPEEGVGDILSVVRRYFKREAHRGEIKLIPINGKSSLKVGDEVEVQLSLRAKHPMEYVHLRDPRGAGFEPVDAVSQHKWNLGLYWYEELRDSGTNFFFEKLPQGEHTFKYRIRAATAGTFKVGPAQVQPLYAPEINGFSSGQVLEVK